MRRRAFRSTALLKETMAGYYRSFIDRGEGTAPVAWCTSVGPVEVLRALGFRVHFPENHSAMLGASRTANTHMGRAHALGYSPDICSYLTSDIGAYLAHETPLSAYGLDEVPKADVLVYNTNQCREVLDWMEYYGREWGVPVVGVNSVRMVGEVTDAHIESVVRQIEALIPVLEGIAGMRLDAGRLEETVRLSRECSDLWRACLETARNRPAPLTFFDGTIHMGPAVTMRGLPEACDYYRVFLAELSERVAEGTGAVAGERFRLYWEGMPLWGKLREQSELFAELGTAVVASTYCNSWIADALEPSDPIRSMARASLELFISRSEPPKEAYIEQMVRLFEADGILFHDTRTCPHNSNARYGMPGRLRERLGIPVLIVEGDQTDLRCYSAEQAKTSIEGFIEQLDEFQAVSGGTR